MRRFLMSEVPLYSMRGALGGRPVDCGEFAGVGGGFRPVAIGVLGPSFGPIFLNFRGGQLLMREVPLYIFQGWQRWQCKRATERESSLLTTYWSESTLSSR